MDYPGYPVNRNNYYSCERPTPGYLAWTTWVTRLTGTTIIQVNALHRDISGTGTTSTVMRMTSIRTWLKLQVPNVNTHNMQEEIRLIDKEQHQKEKVSRKLIKQRFC